MNSVEHKSIYEFVYFILIMKQKIKLFAKVNL